VGADRHGVGRARGRTAVRELCRPAREVAAWYEANPDQLWLSSHLEHLRGTEWLSIADLRSIIGMEKDRTSVDYWLARNPEVQQKTAGRVRRWARFADVQRVLLESVPANFPWFNGDKTQPYSSTLIVVRRNEVNPTKSTYPCVLGYCGVPTFERWLSGDANGRPSVFARWGLTERDGSPIEITTHSFRYWLNTVAQFRGMGDLDIAKWSGRDPSQNRAYNHVTPEETLSQIRELIEENGGVGALFEAACPERINRPVSRKDFLNAQIGSAHATDYGICIHDYSLLPCQALGDCLGCSENVFMKGDGKHREKIEQHLELALIQLEQSKAAETEEIYGADRWTQSHIRKIELMRTILAVHEDHSIRDGAIINLEAARQDNEVAMAIRDRNTHHGNHIEAETPVDWDAGDALKTIESE
jgi:hypothetical protein